MTRIAELVREKANECVLSHDGKYNGAEAIINGYYIWWCNTHKQPWAWCEKDIAIKIAEKLEVELKRLNADITACLLKSKEVLRE